DDIRLIRRQQRDILPAALDKQSIAESHPLLLQIMQEVLLLPLDAENIDSILLPKSGMLDQSADQAGVRRQHHLGNAHFAGRILFTLIRRRPASLRNVMIEQG